MIGGGWQVLDVGSGDRPFPPATVLVDQLPRRLSSEGEVRAENPRAEIVSGGKPFVVGEIEALPFADQSFDIVYASHVLEHVVEPVRALTELARVAPRGYIETPRAWFEFVDASPFHRWLIDLVDGELWFRPKTEVESRFMGARRLFDAEPALFHQFYRQVFGNDVADGRSVEKSICHVCVYWEEHIPFRVLPPPTYREESDVLG